MHAATTASDTATVTPICGQWNVPAIASRTIIVTLMTGTEASAIENWMPGVCRNITGTRISM